MSSIDGIISGFNTATIIDGLVAIQQRQIDQFSARKTGIGRKQTAFRGIEARLATLRSSMSRLNRTVGTVFDSRTATSSNTDLVDVAASSGAQQGVFSIKVNSLAAAHQIGSQGFDAVSSAVTSGTFSIQTGSRQAENFTIDGTNNTLESMVNTINSQSTQVSASIIRDSASGQYRMLLASKSSGTDNAINVTNNLDADNGGAIRPVFNSIEIQAATNASITFGSGPGAITSEYQTNRIDNVVRGVTLNLKGADTAKLVNISVSQDDAAVVEAVDKFVTDYNDIIKYLNDQSSFTSETGAAGLLLGNRSVSTVRSNIEKIISSSVPGLSSNFNRLSRIGIGIADKGLLTFDQSQLTRVLEGREAGVAATDVRKLFGLNASSSNAGIEFVLGTSRTGSPSSPVEVDIVQAAKKASLTASKDLESSIVIDGTNREFSFTLDGQESGTLLLAEGTYTQEELANHLKSVINNSSSLGGRTASVSVEAGKLKMSSDSWGTASKLGGFGGTALEALGMKSTDSAVGQDVAGRFIVDGVVETAKGTGRLLAGDLNNKFTADLQVRVTLAESQVNAGVEGTLNLSRGISGQLDQTISSMLDAEKGILSTVNKQFEDQIASVDASISRVDAITTAKREYLTRQFANLERILGDLQSTSSLLSSQLSSLNSLNSR